VLEVDCLMSGQTKIERRLDRDLGRAQTPRGAAIVIASVTTSITVLAGLAMTFVDRDEFPSVGTGLWWAVQTVTTVGYGDRVPTTAPGQIVAAIVMLLGIGFVTVITAAITSSFVARSRQLQADTGDAAPSADALSSIDERLARIEAALNDRS
jgi:voltage-gated potassium channel